MKTKIKNKATSVDEAVYGVQSENKVSPMSFDELHSKMGNTDDKDVVAVDVKQSKEKGLQPVDPYYNIQIVEDYDGTIDVFHLSKRDPNYEYRFIRNDFNNISIKTGNTLLQHGGWQLCDRKFLIERLGMKESQISPDGFYKVNDTILAFIPKALFEKKIKKKNEEANAPVQAIKRFLKHGNKEIDELKVHPSLKGLQTAQQLGMKTGD